MDSATYKTVHPYKCDCHGTGLIPPRRVSGKHQVRCPYHRPLNEWWPQLQGDGTVKFIQTVKNGRRIT